MPFPKPHLTYQEQVQLMASRGLDVGDEAAAVAALKRIGYYRLSGYTYPMRVELPVTDPKMRPRRDDQFVEGARLADAVSFHDFDHKLRRAVLAAAQTLEVGLRSRIAYRLSHHDPIGHLTQTGLDPVMCSEPNRGPDHEGTRYDSWRREYDSLQSKAKDEDYVRHFRHSYGGTYRCGRRASS